MLDSANSTNDMSDNDENVNEAAELRGRLTKDDLRALIKAGLGDAATNEIIEAMIATTEMSEDGTYDFDAFT